MKVIIVNDHARIVGGAAKIAIMSALALAERGFDVEFFAACGPVGPELERDPRVKVTCLGIVPHNRDPRKLRGAIRGLWFRDAGRKMREILKGSDPKDTVVHLHTYRDALTTSAAYVASKMGFTLVYTAHEYSMGCPYGVFFDFPKNRICQLTGLSAACLKTRCNTGSYGKKLWYYLGQFIYSRLCRMPSRLSHVVFISELNKRALIPYLPKGARFTIISNPVDYAGATPSKIDERSPFLYIGSLDRHKDPVTAARAARILNAPITFVGAGPIDDQVRSENPDAVLTGWVGREEVERRLQESRALVFPSIWFEAQPCTTMEASACGLPIIVSDKCSAVEQVESLGVGEVFEGGNVDDLVEKMRPYLDTEFARKQGLLSQAAYRKQDLSTEHHVACLLDVYESELSRRS